MFLVNSRLGLFLEAYSRRHPLSLSYGVILPSSLTTVLSLALGFSPYPPVSVLVRATLIWIETFPVSVKSDASILFSLPFTAHIFSNTDLPILPNLLLGHAFPFACSSYPPASFLLLFVDKRRYRNLYLLSIRYAFLPFLRSRLTLSGRTFLRNPWVFGRKDSHLPLATHANILSRISSRSLFNSPSSYHTMLFYHSLRESKASVVCLSPGNFRRKTTRPVSYYALF